MIFKRFFLESLGHSNIGITLDTYSHVLPGMQEDAIGCFDDELRTSMAKVREEKK